MRILPIILKFPSSGRVWKQGKYAFNIIHSNPLLNRNRVFFFCLQCSLPLLQVDDLC